MKRFFSVVFLMIISANFLFSQVDNNLRAKLYFQEAQKLFNQNEFSASLDYLTKAEKVLQATNGRILNLKIKILYNTGKFIEAENALNLFISYYGNAVSEELKNETLSYFIRIEKAAKAQRNREKERLDLLRKKELARIARLNKIKKEKIEEEKKFKILAKKLEPDIKKRLQQLSQINYGKIYIFKPINNLTTSRNEVSYFVAYNNKYIIFTIPDKYALRRLNKDRLSFSSVNAKRFSSNVTNVKVKTKHDGKKWLSFRKSVQYSNVFLGGNGDEILWNGKQYSSFKKNVYYYFYVQSLSADIKLKKTFDKKYYNPYIETGTIIKTVDYRLISNNEIRSQLKRNGFINKPGSTTNPNLPAIKLKSARFRKMLFPEKKINYVLQDKKVSGSYIHNRRKYTKPFLYFIPTQKTSHYGTIQYYGGFYSSNLANRLYEINEDKKVNQIRFGMLYDSFNKGYGSGTIRYFTNTSYKLPYEILVQLSQLSEKGPVK